jgi:hypothetical protein
VGPAVVITASVVVGLVDDASVEPVVSIEPSLQAVSESPTRRALRTI